MKTVNCPQRGNVRKEQFSCGTARLFAKAKTVTDTPKEVSAMLPKFDLSKAVEEKKTERFAGRKWFEVSVSEQMQFAK